MNVLFFLTPKSQIKYCLDTMSIRQVLEIMEFHRYQVIPILSKDGKYVGSISEGDLLYYLKSTPFSSIDKFNNIPITKVNRYKDYIPVSSSTEISSLIVAVTNQNFVPVLDDKQNFIGIITRKSIIKALALSAENSDFFEN